MNIIIEKLAVAGISVGLLLNGLLSGGDTEVQPPAIPNEVEQQTITEQKIPAITKEQELYLAKLINCESGDNPLARNDHDRDNLSAKGLYQFKDKTWRFYIKKYDLWNWRNWEEADFENAIWSREHQEVVLRYMLNDEDVNFKREFPQCVKRLGLPPR